MRSSILLVSLMLGIPMLGFADGPVSSTDYLNSTESLMRDAKTIEVKLPNGSIAHLSGEHREQFLRMSGVKSMENRASLSLIFSALPGSAVVGLACSMEGLAKLTGQSGGPKDCGKVSQYFYSDPARVIGTRVKRVFTEAPSVSQEIASRIQADRIVDPIPQTAASSR